MEDNEEKTGESGDSTRLTSMINTVYLESSYPREQLKIYGCLSPATTTELTTSPFDRPISPSIALSSNPVE